MVGLDWQGHSIVNEYTLRAANAAGSHLVLCCLWVNIVFIKGKSLVTIDAKSAWGSIIVYEWSNLRSFIEKFFIFTCIIVSMALHFSKATSWGSDSTISFRAILFLFLNQQAHSWFNISFELRISRLIWWWALVRGLGLLALVRGL